MLTSPTPSLKPALPISLPTSCTSWATDLRVPGRLFGTGTFPIVPRAADRSARPPSNPAAAAVPTSAGIFALSAALPTVSPTLVAADPTVSPMPSSTPDTPLADEFDRDFRELADEFDRDFRELAPRALRADGRVVPLLLGRDLLLVARRAGVLRLRAVVPLLRRLAPERRVVLCVVWAN